MGDAAAMALTAARQLQEVSLSFTAVTPAGVETLAAAAQAEGAPNPRVPPCCARTRKLRSLGLQMTGAAWCSGGSAAAWGIVSLEGVLPRGFCRKWRCCWRSSAWTAAAVYVGEDSVWPAIRGAAAASTDGGAAWSWGAQ